MTAATDKLAASLFGVAEALRAACNDPADAVRLLLQLATYDVATVASTAPIGASITTAQEQTAALCRRAALLSLARACAEYVPSSYDDAASLRDKVAAVLDAEILRVGDMQQGASYLALRNLRTAVVDDLNTRGAQLARLRTVTTREPAPSLVLAYDLYADASRADELAQRADAPHPGIMPLSFRALSE
ncbi:hypothetical protein [Roseomonas elaeocarpi]|uniref:Uncharacterized protein n=1 Tax=Roseomonas elaeocarpi TaxID=907779 RepID=A0ABV6JQA9_9PROT